MKHENDYNREFIKGKGIDADEFMSFMISLIKRDDAKDSVDHLKEVVSYVFSHSAKFEYLVDRFIPFNDMWDQIEYVEDNKVDQVDDTTHKKLKLSETHILKSFYMRNDIIQIIELIVGNDKGGKYRLANRAFRMLIIQDYPEYKHLLSKSE